MVDEIEKKFLLSENDEDFTTPVFHRFYPSLYSLTSGVLVAAVHSGCELHQGYLPIAVGSELLMALSHGLDFEPVEMRLRSRRVFVSSSHQTAYFFTAKGEGGLQRGEFEREISQGIFNEFWGKTKGRRIEKFRLSVPFGEYLGEVDLYIGRKLMVAEFEVSADRIGGVPIIGKDVTENPAYKNKNLAR